HRDDVDHRIMAAFALDDVDPAMALPRHFRGHARMFVAVIFVVRRQRAIVAVEAFGDVDDEVPFLHRPAPHSAGTRAGRPALAGLRAAERRSAVPSHSSTSTRQELAAVPVTFLAIERLGVSW